MFDYRKNVVVMDIECYTNYFLVAFRDTINTSRTKRFEMRYEHGKLDVDGIKKMLRGATIITFNGNNYDMPMLMLALTGATCSELKEASDTIIVGKMKGWQFMREAELNIPAYVDHIDLFEIPKGVLSLKAYSARIGCKKLQDLPIEPDAILTYAEMDAIADYCDNDTANTTSLFLHNEIKPSIDLRVEFSKEYGIDLRSKSDAQLGETVLKLTIEKATGRKLYKPDFNDIKKTFSFDIADYIVFENGDLSNLLNILKRVKFKVDYVKGHVKLPDELTSYKISINSGTYTIGIGGLHSNEESQAIIAKDGWFIIDADVGSYYPSLIINGGYYPSTLGKTFLEKYTQIRDDRLRMKPDISKKVIVELYKIVLNGSFGKLSSMYSFLYSPKMLIQVTITGQLCLLMLIERLEKAGLRVVSANTDGIVINGKNEDRDLLDKIVHLWEVETGLTMEYTEYSAIYSQSVNSYLALKPNGKWKRKGNYAERSLSQTGNGQVCVEAVMAFIKDGTPIRETIQRCDDFIKFTNFQQVKGGAYKDGEYLGKVVRWYYSTSTNTPILNSKGGVVSLTKGAMPCMELPEETPTDIDYNWYVREAHSMLDRLGVTGIPREQEAFGLSNGKPKWGRKVDQSTYHLIDPASKDALCEARLKDRHDEWEYLSGLSVDGIRYCSKCKKKEG